MNAMTSKPPAAAAPAEAAAVALSPARQCEPNAGGSYIRIPATGMLVKNEQPVLQPKQE
jgi:hypothetical protein